MNSKHAVVTGASRGIGKAIAKKLAMEGYNLTLICNKNIDMLNETAASLSSAYGIGVTCHCGDVGDESFANDIFKDIASIDVLVNNAAISHVGLLQDMTFDMWHQTMSTNLDSVFYFSKASIPLMLQAGSGKIINISSVWGSVGASMEVAYSTSKGAVNAFTRALGKELAPSGISVNAIACGIIDTDMNGHLTDDEISDIVDGIPIDRLGTTSEVADMVYNIINAPDYLTGQVITLDGGWI